MPIQMKILRNGFINKSIKANTIIETLFAMLVIATTFSICMTIFANLIFNDISNKQLLAKSEITLVLAKIKCDKSYFDQKTVLANNWILESRFKQFENQNNSLMVTVEVRDSMNIIIYQQNEIIHIEN